MVRVGKGAPLVCVSGVGIADDVHANRLSPRQILITAESELEALSIAPGALRENVVLALEDPAVLVPGSAIISSRGVEIGLTMYCEPCKRISSVVPDLKRMLYRRGVLGYVVRGGELFEGEELTVVGGQYDSLPESPFDKFVKFVELIPPGKVLRYLDVTIAMGVADSFVRAVPGYIKKGLALGLPVHRIVSGGGELSDHIPLQAELLAAEGVSVRVESDLLGSCNRSVDLELHLWRG